MTTHVTRVVEQKAGFWQGTCKGCPDWDPPMRCTSTGAIADCKQHKLRFPSSCSSEGCTREARMSIRTIRPEAGSLRRMGRDRIYTVVDYDDRTAPDIAPKYCKQCGLDILLGIAQVLVNRDEESHATVRKEEELADDSASAHG